MYSTEEHSTLAFMLYRAMTELTVENYMTFEYHVELLGNPGDKTVDFMGDAIHADSIDAKIRAIIWFEIDLILNHNEDCAFEQLTAKELVDMLTYLQNKWQ